MPLCLTRLVRHITYRYTNTTTDWNTNSKRNTLKYGSTCISTFYVGKYVHEAILTLQENITHTRVSIRECTPSMTRVTWTIHSLGLAVPLSSVCQQAKCVSQMTASVECSFYRFASAYALLGTCSTTGGTRDEWSSPVFGCIWHIVLP